MSKYAKILLVLCLGLAGIPQAFAQDEEAGDTNFIEVPTTDSQVLDTSSRESTELNRLMFVSIGQARAPKIIVRQFRFRPVDNHERVYGVRIVGTQSLVDIQGAEVVLRNGEVYSLNDLRGYLEEGQRRRVFFGQFGVRIESIHISATSPNLIGPRGMFRVDVLVDR